MSEPILAQARMPAWLRVWLRVIAEPKYFVLLLQGFLFVTLFWPTWGWMAERFDASDSFYGHGWLVPFVSGWLVWQRRETLKRCPCPSTWAAVAPLAVAVLVHMVAWRLRIGFVSGFAMIAVLALLIYANFGSQALRILRLPLVFLMFMVPVPGVLLIAVSFKMKLWAATLATHIIHWIGISAVQEGSTIQVPGVKIIVDDVCSGLRSLISLAAISFLWASQLPPATRMGSRLVLVVGSMPIALVTNMVRILLLIFIATVYGAQAAKGFIHFWSGIVVYGLAVLILAVLGRLVAPKPPRAV